MTVAQLPLFEPEAHWTPPDLGSLPEWGSARRIGIDVETKDPDLTKLGPGVRRGAHIVGFCVAIEDGPEFYLPVRHEGGGNLPLDNVLSYMRSQAKRFEGEVCGANLSYDLDFLWEEGIEFPACRWYRDTMVADPLINELHRSYSLEATARRWGVPGKDETLLMEALAAYGFKGKNAKGGIYALHSRHVGPYGEQDARLPLTLLRRQEAEIDEQDLWEVYNLESRVLPVLVKMRRRGVRVSETRLNEIARWAREQQQLAIDEANRVAPNARLAADDITKPAALARVLRDLGVDLPKTATGKDSVTKAVMERIDHPIGDHLRRAKKMSTLRSTFVDGTRGHLINGRIHCTFNQLRRQKDDGSGETEGAAYGRLSSANPNLQNQPARDPEIGPRWRSIYLPEEGSLWASMDYSQQEPRQAVHFAVEAGPSIIGERAWASAKEAARRYREDPTTDFHQMMADMAGIDRKPAKNIYLGLSYGMGGPKLCRDLGLPTAWRMCWWEGRRRKFADFATREEAVARADAGRAAGYKTAYWEIAGPEGQALMDRFNAEVPFISRMAKSCDETAAQRGYIRTLSGRKCRFPTKDDGTFDWTHKGFNRLIQGSSADQTKMSVVELDAEGYPIQLQVHDEITMSTPDEATANAAAGIMENVVELQVPSKVDVEIGASWGESM